MDHTLFEEFCCSIQLITGVIRELGEIEEQKAAAAAESRHGLMDNFLKQEQVLLLKLRGLEKNRLRLSENLGWKDLTFRQILEQVPDQQRETLLPYFSELDKKTKQLLESKDNAQRMITFRLAEFEHLLAGQEMSYDEKGKIVSTAPHAFREQYV